MIDQQLNMSVSNSTQFLSSIYKKFYQFYANFPIYSRMVQNYNKMGVAIIRTEYR